MRTKAEKLRNFGHKISEKTVSYTWFFHFLILSGNMYTGRLSGRPDTRLIASPCHPIRGPPMT